MKYKLVVGVDIGKQGAISCMDIESNTIVVHKMPVNSANEISLPELSRLFDGFIEIYGRENIILGIEYVHSVFISSAKSNFQFGSSLGIIEGYLGSFKIPFIKVTTKIWQKIAHLGVPIVRKPATKEQIAKNKEGSLDTKAMSMVACERLFPTLDTRASSRSKKPHDGIVDATLIAYYIKTTI